MTTPHTMYIASLKKKFTIRLYPNSVIFLYNLVKYLEFLERILLNPMYEVIAQMILRPMNPNDKYA